MQYRCLGSVAAYTAVLWAMHYADVRIVSALRETSVFWAIVLGRVFLGEASRGGGSLPLR
jgi:drug/metabolite transporter (DMT)-like permease